MGPKSRMNHVKHTQLHVNDIMLVECRIQRYGSDMARWAEGWRSTFYLDSITRLYAAPEDAPDEPESAMEDERVPTDDEVEM